MVLILADLAAPECCWAAAGLRVGMGTATRHPKVWRWWVEPCDRAQGVNATTGHTGCRQSRDDELSHLLQQRSVGFLSGGDGGVRLMAQGAAHSTSVR